MFNNYPPAARRSSAWAANPPRWASPSAHVHTLALCLRRRGRDHRANTLLLVLSHHPGMSAGPHRSASLNNNEKKSVFAQILTSPTPTGVLSGTDSSKSQAGKLNQRKSDICSTCAFIFQAAMNPTTRRVKASLWVHTTSVKRFSWPLL